MAEAWGAIERFLGAVLNGVFEVIPSYGVAIIVLTILVRIVLIPLTVKQIRSMSAMQKIQPELKKIQQKYKGDRQKMNEELMKLYREHGVNPLGGCFPLLMQAPVFIALYSVLRAAVPFDAAVAEPVVARIRFDNNTICRPVGDPAPTGPGGTTVICRNGNRTQEFTVEEIEQQKITPPVRLDALPAYVSRCVPAVARDKNPDEVTGFRCESPGGSGHLPKDGELFRDIVRDRASFLGMHLACSPTQVTNKNTIAQCTSSEESGAGGKAVIYYVLVALMMGTTYYQQKQMQAQATGPQAKQMQMMGRIMPLFLGFISLSIPSGVIIYWIVSNVWTIGQQAFFLQRTHAPAAAGNETPGKGDGEGKGRPPVKKPQQKPKRKR